MKKLFLLTMMIMVLIIAGCTSDMDVQPTENSTTETLTTANAKVVFDIVSTEQYQTRTASVEDNWPNASTKTNAEATVKSTYTDLKNEGLSFFVNNYSVALNNVTTNSSITTWNGSTTLSLTEKDSITVALTPNTVGKFPKFKLAKGWINLSNLDLDTETPAFTSDNYGGDIEIGGISNTNGVVNVTIKVKLTYDSYLLVAPDANWSILTNVKGFKTLKWGGSNGTNFFTQSISGGTWWYYWGNGNDYVWGKGALIQYGFNLYSDGTKDIKVENGKWYALFASLNSAGEGDDDTDNPNDTDKTHTVGGDNGITPTANDIVGGGAIR